MLPLTLLLLLCLLSEVDVWYARTAGLGLEALTHKKTLHPENPEGGFRFLKQSDQPYTAKLSPQPHSREALGLLKLKPLPSKPPLNSNVELCR